ncbi:putative NADH:ubiquinone reductase (non-electrogenic) [Helianthus anomalus]
MKDNEFFRNGKIQETIVDEVIDDIKEHIDTYKNGNDIKELSNEEYEFGNEEGCEMLENFGNKMSSDVCYNVATSPVEYSIVWSENKNDEILGLETITHKENDVNVEDIIDDSRQNERVGSRYVSIFSIFSDSNLSIKLSECHQEMIQREPVLVPWFLQETKYINIVNMKARMHMWHKWKIKFWWAKISWKRLSRSLACYYHHGYCLNSFCVHIMKNFDFLYIGVHGHANVQCCSGSHGIITQWPILMMDFYKGFHVQMQIWGVGVRSCEVNTFNTPGVVEYLHFIKEVKDAQKIRRSVMDCFEKAILSVLTKEERRISLHFVIVGGGPTGVESATELHVFVHEDIVELYQLVVDLVRVTLIQSIQSGDHILNMYKSRISTFAEQKFAWDGIDVNTGCGVLGVLGKIKVRKKWYKKLHFGNIPRYGFKIFQEVVLVMGYVIKDLHLWIFVQYPWLMNGTFMCKCEKEQFMGPYFISGLLRTKVFEGERLSIRSGDVVWHVMVTIYGCYETWLSQYGGDNSTKDFGFGGQAFFFCF